jgi:hypothetical protein
VYGYDDAIGADCGGNEESNCVVADNWYGPDSGADFCGTNGIWLSDDWTGKEVA